MVHPVLRSALISCTSMAAGDAMCQCIRSRAASSELRVNWRQSMRFGVVGLTLHGPFFYQAYKWLDSRFGTAATLQRAAIKTVAGQVTVFPVYVCSFFFYMGLLEGLNPEQCLSKVQQAVPATLWSGTLFWPAANIANFMLVPPAGRVAYANAAGLLWNAWLSSTNSTKGAVAAAAAAAGPAAASGSGKGRTQ